MLKVRVTKKLNFADRTGDLDICLDLEENSFNVLTGPSGSGKTSFMRCIAGLATPDSGSIVCSDEIWFDSSVKINIPPYKRKTGFVFQDYALFRKKTVLSNMRYACRDDSFIKDLLRLSGLDSLSHCYPSILSGGQKQRLALIRSLSTRPRILLLDEPLSATDHTNRSRLQEAIKTLCRKNRTTTIMVSHDLEEIYRMADRVITIDSGRIISDSEPSKFAANPESSHKLYLPGVILGINHDDVSSTITASCSNQPLKLVTTRSDASEFKKGEKVHITAKAFHLGIMKLEDRNE